MRLSSTVCLNDVIGVKNCSDNFVVVLATEQEFAF